MLLIIVWEVVNISLGYSYTYGSGYFSSTLSESFNAVEKEEEYSLWQLSLWLHTGLINILSAA